MLFMSLVFGQLLLVYPARRFASPAGVTNYRLNMAVAFGVALQITALVIPQLRSLLRISTLTSDMAAVLAVSLLAQTLLALALPRVLTPRPTGKASRE